MAKLTFLGLAEKVLREENKPLSPSEMWKIALAKGYDKQLETKGKTPQGSLYSIIMLNERDKSDSVFEKIGERPARYFLKELMAGGFASPGSPADDAAPCFSEYSEADLHPFLAYYAQIHFKAYTKTIKHNISKKKEFGEWVHPDMIGVHFAVEDWKGSVFDLSAATGYTGVKLYSFELKKSLSFANLREAFFQAVSNSSWAHEGYLGAADINEDEDFRGELRRLSASFGIGVIRIDLDDPDDSDILFPARMKESIDWETLDKLTKMNQVVEDLLVRIKNDLQMKEVIKEKYDAILTRDNLLKSVKKKAS